MYLTFILDAAVYPIFPKYSEIKKPVQQIDCCTGFLLEISV